MANKYLISGATYCGDGTASNEAASAGAAGAWNNTNILTGTAPAYGTLSAGDVVRIRSKTSAGADITITTGTNANIGKSGLTGNDVVHWIVDDGTTWAGVVGTLTFGLSAGVTWTVLAGNLIEALTQDKLVFLGYAGSQSNPILIVAAGAELRNPLIDNTPNTTYGSTVTNHGVMRSPHLKFKLRYQYGISASNYGRGVFFDPDIEITDATETEPIFSVTSYASSILVYGGRVRGAGAVSGVPVCSPVYNQSSGISLYGLKYPYAMPLTLLSGWTSETSGRVISTGADGSMGATLHDRTGGITSRYDGNFPTLNATLPDSGSTLWSYLLEPRNAKKLYPEVLVVRKLYTEAAAAKTITLELLVGTQFGEIAKNTCWAEFSYVDNATGDTVTLSTYDPVGGALDSSSAAWSQTTYGAVSFNKCKFAVTTPSSIASNTVIEARLMVGTPQVVVTEDLLIVCPDVQLT